MTSTTGKGLDRLRHLADEVAKGIAGTKNDRENSARSSGGLENLAAALKNPEKQASIDYAGTPDSAEDNARQAIEKELEARIIKTEFTAFDKEKEASAHDTVKPAVAAGKFQGALDSAMDNVNSQKIGGPEAEQTATQEQQKPSSLPKLAISDVSTSGLGDMHPPSTPNPPPHGHDPIQH